VMSYVNAPATLAKLVGADNVQAGFQQIAGTISTNYLLDPVADRDKPPLIEHARIMQQYGGPPINSLSVYGQTLAELTVETLKIACKNGDMTRQGVMNAAESVKDFAPSLIYPGIKIGLGKDDHFAIQSLVPTEIQASGVLKALTTEPISVE